MIFLAGINMFVTSIIGVPLETLTSVECAKTKLAVIRAIPASLDIDGQAILSISFPLLMTIWA